MRSSTVIIGPKTQVVIPKSVRSVAEKIRPGQKVLVRPLSKSSVIIEAYPSSWTKETYGMHKDVWQGVDAADYINTIRNEWQTNRYQ